MANTAFGHDATLTTPGSTTDTALVRWANTSGTSLNNTINILSDGSNITLNARGEVRFSDADSSHYIAFESPATVGTSYTMTLPADLPAADEVLTVTSYSGGAGVLEWAAAGGGIASVVADTTPQLGGNLDMQARLLVGNGGSTGIAISANGEVTMAAQPAVAAFNSSSDTGATGDGTAATVDFNTEVYDQNADFASYTFTAPITGRYQVNANVRWYGTTANTYVQLRIVSSNRDWFTYADDIQGGQDNDTVMISALIDMDAADTLTIVFKHYGESSNVVAVYGAAAPHTYVTVHLVA